MKVQAGLFYATSKGHTVGPLRIIEGASAFGPQAYFDDDFFPGIWHLNGMPYGSQPYGSGGKTTERYGRIVCEVE